MRKKNILQLIGLTFAGFLFLTTTGTAEGALLKKYTAITNNWGVNLWKDGFTDWGGTIEKIIFNAPAGTAMADYLQANSVGNGTYFWIGGSYDRARLTSIRGESDGSISGILDANSPEFDNIQYFLDTVSIGGAYPSYPATLCYNGSGATGGTCGGAFNGSGDMYLYSSISDDLIIGGGGGESPAFGALTFATSTGSGVVSMLTNLLADPGFQGVIAFAIGLPLTLFYIIPKIKDLFPKNKRKK